MDDTIHSTSNSLFKHTTPGDGVLKKSIRDNFNSRRYERKSLAYRSRQSMFPTNHSTSDIKTMTIVSGKPVKPTATELTTTTTTNRKPKYLVAVFSVLVVCIVAVLVVTVASQARNSTRQQQMDEDAYNNNVVLSATELRHPRYIGRPVTAPADNSTAESIIMKNVKALVMRVVVGPAETLGNNSNSSDGTSVASRQILYSEIDSADKEPDSRGASGVISRNN